MYNLFLWLILQNQALNTMKRKMAADLTRLFNENQELISEFHAADERAKKAMLVWRLLSKNIQH